MDAALLPVLLTAAAVGVVHTFLGPDHTLPFVAMGRARGWSLRRTLAITLACGTGHVAGSVVLGLAGIALGWSLLGMTALEGTRGSWAGWLLLAFGLAYTVWGVRRALRERPHSHWHVHADGTAHTHPHGHHGAHAHVHTADAGGRPGTVTPWALFVIFVLGPCEPLIPLLMVPGAEGSWGGVALVAAAFGGATLATMAGLVAVGFVAAERLRAGRTERWAHALAGSVVLACGLAVTLGL